MKKSVWLFVLGMFLIMFMIGLGRANEYVEYGLELPHTYTILPPGYTTNSNCLNNVTSIDTGEKVEIQSICYPNPNLNIGERIFIIRNVTVKINRKKYHADMIWSATVNLGTENIFKIINSSDTIINVNLIAQDGSVFSGAISMALRKESLPYSIVFVQGVIINNQTVPSSSGNYEPRISSLESSSSSQSQRISTLEYWKTTIDTWKATVTTTLTNLGNSITSLFTTTSNQETRIANLEGQNTTAPNITLTNYWKYLGSSDRKAIVCGLAQDNHLSTLTMQELGWRCNVTYRQTSRGESSSCRCSKL